MIYIPIGNNIMFEPINPEFEGIMKGFDTAHSERGTVKAVGPDVKQAQIGDTIIIKGYGVTKNEDEGNLWFIREDPYIVLSIIRND